MLEEQPSALASRDQLDMSGSRYMRVVDVVSMSVFFVFQGLLAREVLGGLANFPDHAWWIVSFGAVGGYLWADFVSGFAHFFADTYGSVQTPFLGPVVFRTFREHHVDPLAITRHDFFEINGVNCLVSIPFLVATYALVPVREGLFGLAFGAFMLLFLVGIFLTNQFHCWAHLPAPPRWIRRLQATGLILGPAHHQRHHTPPFDTYYCITSGLMNPVLSKIRFFERIKEPLRRVFEPLIGRAEEVIEPAGEPVAGDPA